MNEEIRTAVKGPALGLVWMGGLGIFWHIASAVVNVIYGGGWLELFFGLPAELIFVQVAGELFCVLVYGFLIYCAMKMKEGSSYALAITGAVLSMIPCNCCCAVGIPVGIWALLVLNKPEVKEAFDSVTASTGETF